MYPWGSDKGAGILPGASIVVFSLNSYQTHQIEVEHGPIGVGEKRIGLLRGVTSSRNRGVDLFDDVVGRHDPHVVVVHVRCTHGIVGAEALRWFPHCANQS